MRNLIGKRSRAKAAKFKQRPEAMAKEPTASKTGRSSLMIIVRGITFTRKPECRDRTCRPYQNELGGVGEEVKNNLKENPKKKIKRRKSKRRKSKRRKSKRRKSKRRKSKRRKTRRH